MPLHTIGSRYADSRTLQASADRPNTIAAGHQACPGCGEVLGARYVLDAATAATGGRLIVLDATGCLQAFDAAQPTWLQSPPAKLAALAADAVAQMTAQGRDDVRVLAQAGDRASVDAGFAGLSALFERNDDVLYVCYDNEGAMSTPGAPRGPQRDLPRLALAAAISYTATASIADLADLERKVRRAVAIRGARYLHVHTPCPTGWGTAACDTIRVARLAIECGLFPVFEAEGGAIVASRKIRHRLPVADYLKPQKRFAHLLKDPGEASRLQASADANISQFHLLGGKA
jgi:pyruvate ferredoxin oxidoreductase beta subunit